MLDSEQEMEVKFLFDAARFVGALVEFDHIE